MEKSKLYFRIALYNWDVYFCGQTVTGKIDLHANEELENEKIVTVKLKGTADVSWTEYVSLIKFVIN